ncbi:MAG: transmembrane protein [Ignavibacteria bacterium]|nr:MAG: transmembrane protein [Ignavibacteria bacterium]KAF0159866.1 MAG: transmembrane protein [Ignavibacteria bacterium]
MKNSSGRNILGIILMIIGGLWIIDNFNLFGFLDFPFHHLIFSWHTFFVIVGAVIISNNNKTFWGYLLLGIGLVGWLKHMPFVPFAHFLNFRDLWPLILFGLGLWLILNQKEKSNNSSQEQKCGIGNNNPFTQANTNNFSSSNTSEYPLDYINESASFTSIEKRITTQSFKGGKVAATFGSVLLDFRQAKLAPGEHILDLSVAFGGVELYFAQDWKVIVNVSSVFGGFDDQRYSNFNAATSSASILIIKGSVVFGGGELKN